MAKEKEGGLSPGRFAQSYSFEILDLNSPSVYPIVEQELPEIQEDNNFNRLLFIAFEDGICYISRYSSYLNGERHQYASAALYDMNTETIILHNDEGFVLDEEHYQVEDLYQKIKSVKNQRDFFTGEDLSHLFQPVLDNLFGNNEESKIEIPIAESISPEGMELLCTNPPLYKEICIDKGENPLNRERIEELLLLYIMFESSQITEIFTVIEKEPYSDILKDYLDILANLISEAMEENDEIDNIEVLELEAHKRAGCRDSIENVREKQKEFQDYFRYKLIKDEKYCITKDVYDHIAVLGRNLLESADVKNHISKFSSKDKTYFRKTFIKPETGKVAIRSCVDLIKIHSASFSKSISVNIIRKIDGNLEDFSSSISNRNLDVLMAMNSEVVEFEFKHLIEKKQKVTYNFIIVDKNDLHFVFEVSGATLTKWKKKMREKLNRADWHIKNGNFTLPYQFMHNDMSI